MQFHLNFILAALFVATNAVPSSLSAQATHRKQHAVRASRDLKKFAKKDNDIIEINHPGRYKWCDGDTHMDRKFSQDTGKVKHATLELGRYSSNKSPSLIEIDTEMAISTNEFRDVSTLLEACGLLPSFCLRTTWRWIVS